MNKKLIAAAVVAGLAAPMAAQADVTVYGRADIAIANLDVTTTTGAGSTDSKHTIMDDSRGDTRLGFRWSEDLGGGLKALGEFEFAPYSMDVASTTKGTNFYQRQTWAGLKGGFGQIEFGTVLQPYKYAGGVTYDAFVGTLAEARGGDGGMLKSHFGQGGYFGQAIAYRNQFGSAKFALAYSPDDSNDTGNLYQGSKGDLMASLVFGLGAGEVGVAYAKNNTAGDVTAATTVDGQTNSKIFGKYSFGASTVLAQYESSTSNGSSQEGAALKNGSTTDYADVKVMFLAYQFKAGMNTFVIQAGKTSFDGNNQNDINYMAVGGVHSFSKNTKVYLAYRTTKQDYAATTATVNGNTGTDQKGIAVGLIESF